MDQNMFRVFVYGTLQRGQYNHRVIQRARFVGTARTTPQFTLYSLGPFPALVRSGTTAVKGELYAVDRATLAELDRLEGCPIFYQRVPVELGDGTVAESYVQRPDQVCGRSKIASGSWLEHREGRRCESE